MQNTVSLSGLFKSSTKPKVHYHKTSADTVVYMVIRYVAFFGASIVSAIFNLMLFQEMAPQDNLFLYLVLSSVSIVLELTKVSTIVTANLFRDIYLKTGKAAIKFKKNVYFTFYVLLTILSIIASLGFTFTLNENMSSVNNIYLDQLEGFLSQVDSIKKQENSLNDLELETYGINIDNAKDIQAQTRSAQVQQTSSNDQIRVAGVERAEKQASFDKFTAVKPYYDSLQALRSVDTSNFTDDELNAHDLELDQAITVFENQADLANTSERDFVSQYERARSEYNIANDNYNRLNSVFTSTVNNINIATIDTEAFKLQELRDEIAVQTDALLANINSYFATEQVGITVVSLDDANTKLAQRTKDLKDNAGVSVMFREFGKLFRMDPSLITAIILVFVSILIELTIFQTSPDLKPTRRILYFFRNHLTDVDLKKMFKKFDDEALLWSESMGGSTKQLPDPIEEIANLVEENDILEVLEQPIKVDKPKRKKSPKKTTNTDVVEKETTQEVAIDEGAVQNETTEEVHTPLEDTIVSKQEETDTAPPANEEKEIDVSTETTTDLEVAVEKKASKSDSETVAKRVRLHKDDTDVDPKEIATQPKETSSEEDSTTDGANKENYIRYRFARTDERVKAKFISFVNLCIDQKGEFIMDPEEARDRLQLKDSLKGIFLDRLRRLDISLPTGDVPLIVFKDSKWHANFDKDYIIAYATEIVEDK